MGISNGRQRGVLGVVKEFSHQPNMLFTHFSAFTTLAWAHFFSLPGGINQLDFASPVGGLPI